MADQANNLITIPVKPATSHLPGSLGWVQQQLRQVQLQVQPASAGNGYYPGLNYSIGEGKSFWKTLAFIGKAPDFGMKNQNSTDYVAYDAPGREQGHRIYAVAPDGSDRKQGMFPYLTPAAYALVDAFIDEAVAAFRAALDHDDEVQELTFRIEFTAAA